MNKINGLDFAKRLTKLSYKGRIIIISVNFYESNIKNYERDLRNSKVDNFYLFAKNEVDEIISCVKEIS